MGENIHKGHRKRVREKILSGGISGFNSHEILEFLLFYTIPRRDTNELGHMLMSKFGSLSALSQASIDEICEIRGISKKSAAFVKYLPQLDDYIFSEGAHPDDRLELANCSAVREYFREEFRGIGKSVMKLSCLTFSLRLINTVTVKEGEFTGSSEDMNKLVSLIIENRSRDVIIARNYVDDTFLPKDEERRLIKRILNLFKTLEIRLVDYVIVTKDGFPLSLVDAGIMQTIKTNVLL